MRIDVELVKFIFFDEEGFCSFCYDHYPPVYDQFSDKPDDCVKIEKLIDHCQPQEQLNALHRQLEIAHPQRYACAKDRCQPPTTVQTSTEGRTAHFLPFNPGLRDGLRQPIDIIGKVIFNGFLIILWFYFQAIPPLIIGDNSNMGSVFSGIYSLITLAPILAYMLADLQRIIKYGPK